MHEVVAPTGEPVTLEEVRVHLRIENVAVSPAPAAMNAEDIAWVTRTITAARQWAEEFLGFPLSDATYEAVYSAFPTALAEHAVSVVSIQYLDATDALQTLASSAYTYDAFNQTLAAVPSWPAISKKTSPIRIRFKSYYTVGSTTPLVASVPIPQNIKHALLLLIGHWYANREAVGTGSQMPLGVESLLRPLRIRKGMA